jgi:hypothetical protein
MYPRSHPAPNLRFLMKGPIKRVITLKNCKFTVNSRRKLYIPEVVSIINVVTMPASIRIIKIVKDKIGPNGDEEEAYTAEIECEADNAKDLEKELMGCPYGDQIMALLKRAEFIPEGRPDNTEDLKKEAAEQEAAIQKREEELREEGRHEIRMKYLEFLKNKTLTRKGLEKLAEKENEEAKKSVKESEEREEPQNDRDEGFHSIMPHGGP